MLHRFDVDNDKLEELIIGYSTGLIETRRRDTGDIVWAHSLPSPIAGLTVTDIRGEEARDLTIVTSNGDVYGFSPAESEIANSLKANIEESENLLKALMRRKMELESENAAAAALTKAETTPAPAKFNPDDVQPILPTTSSPLDPIKSRSINLEPEILLILENHFGHPQFADGTYLCISTSNPELMLRGVLVKGIQGGNMEDVSQYSHCFGLRKTMVRLGLPEYPEGEVEVSVFYSAIHVGSRYCVHQQKLQVPRFAGVYVQSKLEKKPVQGVEFNVKEGDVGMVAEWAQKNFVFGDSRLGVSNEGIVEVCGALIKGGGAFMIRFSNGKLHVTSDNIELLGEVIQHLHATFPSLLDTKKSTIHVPQEIQELQRMVGSLKDVKMISLQAKAETSELLAKLQTLEFLAEGSRGIKDMMSMRKYVSMIHVLLRDLVFDHTQRLNYANDYEKSMQGLNQRLLRHGRLRIGKAKGEFMGEVRETVTGDNHLDLGGHDAESALRESFFSSSSSLDQYDHFGATSNSQQAEYAHKCAQLLKLIQNTKVALDDLSSSQDAHPLYYPPASSGSSISILQLKTNSKHQPTPSDSNSTNAVSKHVAPHLPTSQDAYISQLLQSKIQEAQSHLDRLRARISDTRSRVLVTGDLNAGKSTFVNSILRREIVPDDQQPCTALFCEVIDADMNGGVEEVHGIRDPSKYNREDPETFERFDLGRLRDVVEENLEGYDLLKVYCKDNRPRNESLLSNGVVDISLIDSPGLNIDSMKTTALFAQQEEIDVIVFVVNSENHFTLSGREFLTTAGKEKAYIFIVCNKFDTIRRKDRCKKDILEQVKEISPLTYKDVDHLVHFTAARHILSESPDETYVTSFHQLENDLRSFVLEKRAQSKLAPAKVYLHNLLNDISILSQHNHTIATLHAEQLSRELIDNAPSFERMLRIKEQTLDNIDHTIEDTARTAQVYAKEQLGGVMNLMDVCAEDLEWGGIVGIWGYARDLRNTIYKMAAVRLRRSEDQARDAAVKCVKNIEEMAKSCMDSPPVIDMSLVSSAFEDGSAEAGRAVAATMFVPLELHDFFDLTDKVEVAKEYLPSLGMIVGGIFGWQRISYGGLRAATWATKGKATFAALAIAGIGLFLYALSDMKSVVDRKVISKMRAHLQDAGLVDRNVERIAKGTKRVLRLAVWEFQNQFQRILSECQTKREYQAELRTQAEIRKDSYRAISTRALTLQRMVSEINLEDHVHSQ
ncbi:mitofusin [Chytridiales sp. JEL 0842]|nr:mitofusin [Chytridiales sp. JEL 0842]